VATKDDGFVEVQENLTPEEEAQQAEAFLEERGLTRDRSGMFRKGGAKAAPVSEPEETEEQPEAASEPDEEPEEEPEAPQKVAQAQEPTGEELISDSLAQKIEQALLAEMPVDGNSIARQRAQENRRVQQAQDEARRAQETLSAVLEEIRGARGRQAAVEQEPEEEIDPFVDPDKWAQSKVAAPLRKEMQALEQRLTALQQQAQAANITLAEEKYAARTPGYRDRLIAFNQAAFQDFSEFFGGDTEKAGQMMNQSYAGWLNLAQMSGREPFEVVHEMAGRYLRSRGLAVPGDGSAAPVAAQQQPAPQAKAPAKPRTDGSIAAARAAVASPAAQGISGGGSEGGFDGPITPAMLVEAGPKGAQRLIRNYIAQHGAKNIDALVSPFEEAAATERGR
jgi:hypothetical protein